MNFLISAGRGFGFGAIVPAVAFMLSTLTLPYLKGIWLRFRKE